jgi:chromosomal replication initiator protein
MSIQEIIQIVSEETHIPVKDITGNSRKESVVTARHLSMWACRYFTEYSLQKISEQHGKNNHATVINACQSIKHMMTYNPQIANLCKLIKNKIN